jgi:hypothetical protein
MKNFSVLLFFIAATCSVALAQSKIPEFDKVKQIKLLKSTREDVKKILADYKLDKDEDEPSYSQTFSTENADIDITYSIGDCSDDSDDTDNWNISKGKVTSIEISLNESLKFEDLKYNVSGFRKEQKYANVENSYVYHNMDLGIAFEVDDGEIETIFLFPTNSYYSWLCENEAAEKFKEFYSTESWFGNTKLEDRTISRNRGVSRDTLADVTDINLSENEIIIGCNNPAQKNSCLVGDRKISVNTLAVDPENDVLTYVYKVSGGEIVGTGNEVDWDLWGVKPGIYTITAGVDDGCGVCGKTQTKTVTVKECPDCSEVQKAESKKP